MFGCAGSSLLLGLPLVAKRVSCSLVVARVLLIVEAPSVRRSASGGRGLQVPGLQSKAQLWQPVGLAAPPHLGSSWTRVQTRVSCIGKEILYHRASRETSLFTPPTNCFSSEYISKATAHLIIQNRVILSEKGCCLWLCCDARLTPDNLNAWSLLSITLLLKVELSTCLIFLIGQLLYTILVEVYQPQYQIIPNILIVNTIEIYFFLT